jgi:hypothetical protein
MSFATAPEIAGQHIRGIITRETLGSVSTVTDTSAKNTDSAIGVISSAIGGMIITNATGVTIETACGLLSELHF